MDDVIYLTVDQVVEIHDEAVREFGGMDGLRSLDLLESAVYQPQQSAFGDDAYPSIASKAAAYAYFLGSNHAFVDGNKRAGANTMLAFLYLNGFRLDRTDSEITEAMVMVATRGISKEDFFLWIVEAVKPDRPVDD